jgi:hypothetical protein
MGPRTFLFVLVPALASLACAKDKKADAPADAANGTVAPASSARATGSAAGGPSPALDVASGLIGAGEAHRGAVRRFEDDPLLAPHAALLARHFFADAGTGPAVGPASGGYAVQEAMLTAGRIGVLVETANHDRPIFLVLDHGKVAWVKERPTGGITSPALHLAVAPHPLGGAVLFFCDPPTRIVGARVWADDGDPFAELEVLHEDACDALSAAYWPGRGWVVVAARAGGARAERLGEDGRIAWGRAGIEVAPPEAVAPSDHGSRLASPVSIVVDTAASVMLLQLSTREDVPARVLGRRLDPEGRLVGTPLDLGPVPRVAMGGERIRARRLAEGVVEATVESAGWTRTIGGPDAGGSP